MDIAMMEESLSPEELRSVREIRDILDKAAGETLFDAAYLLHEEKHRLHALERKAGLRPTTPPSDVSTWEAITRAVQQAGRQLLAERETAQFGPEFDRLKAAHPTVRDSEIRRAIQTVQQLKQDIDNPGRTFSTGNYYQDVEDSVRWAFDRNPGFSEPVFRHLLNNTFIANR